MRFFGSKMLVLLGTAVSCLSTAAPTVAGDLGRGDDPQVVAWCEGPVVLPASGLAFDFRARIAVAGDGTARGEIGLRSPDGTTAYQPLAGRLAAGDGGGERQSLLILVTPRVPPPPPRQGEDVPGDAFGVMALRTAPGGTGISVDLPGAGGASRLRFTVPGRIRTDPGAGALGSSRPATDPWAHAVFSPQDVTLRSPGRLARFRARFEVARNHTANGLVALGPARDARAGPRSAATRLAPPARLEPVFGAVVPTQGTGPGYIIILYLSPVGARPDLATLVEAHIRPDPALPTCDIWDLMGGHVSEGFNALGEITLALDR